MINTLEKTLDTVLPLKRVSVILTEELSGEDEKVMFDSITLEESLKYTVDAKMEETRERLVQSRQKVMAMQQFVIDKLAPPEYKSLVNPCVPVYSIELRKMTFLIAEKETVELRKDLMPGLISGLMKNFADRLGRLGKEKANNSGGNINANRTKKENN